jgi:uncharacterized protein YoxC
MEFINRHLNSLQRVKDELANSLTVLEGTMELTSKETNQEDRTLNSEY